MTMSRISHTVGGFRLEAEGLGKHGSVFLMCTVVCQDHDWAERVEWVLAMGMAYYLVECEESKHTCSLGAFEKHQLFTNDVKRGARVGIFAPGTSPPCSLSSLSLLDQATLDDRHSVLSS